MSLLSRWSLATCSKKAPKQKKNKRIREKKKTNKNKCTTVWNVVFCSLQIKRIPWRASTPTFTLSIFFLSQHVTHCNRKQSQTVFFLHSKKPCIRLDVVFQPDNSDWFGGAGIFSGQGKLSVKLMRRVPASLRLSFEETQTPAHVATS